MPDVEIDPDILNGRLYTSQRNQGKKDWEKMGLTLQTGLECISSFESDVASEFQELSHNGKDLLRKV